MRISIIFDDFYQDESYLLNLMRLKDAFADAKVTLFTIPSKTSSEFLLEIIRFKWIEIGIHGCYHTLNESVKSKAIKELLDIGYAKIYKPPYWMISDSFLRSLNKIGLKVVLHPCDNRDGIKHNWSMGEKELGWRRKSNGKSIEFQRATGDIITTGHIHNKPNCYDGFDICLENLLLNKDKNFEFKLLSEM